MRRPLDYRLWPMTVLLAITACAPLPALRNASMLQDTSLVTGEPCLAPCWQGITPGETAWRDALVFLEDTDEYTEVTPRLIGEITPDEEVATWRQVGGEVCCQVSTRDGETVSVTFLRLAPDMTLGEVIEAYGEPAYLTANDYKPEEAVLNIVFPEHSLLVVVFMAGLETGEIQPENEIIGAVLTTPEDIEQLVQTSELYTWDGYGSYQAYAQSGFDVTPSVTITPRPDER